MGNTRRSGWVGRAKGLGVNREAWRKLWQALPGTIPRGVRVAAEESMQPGCTSKQPILRMIATLLENGLPCVEVGGERGPDDRDQNREEILTEMRRRHKASACHISPIRMCHESGDDVDPKRQCENSEDVSNELVGSPDLEDQDSEGDRTHDYPVGPVHKNTNSCRHPSDISPSFDRVARDDADEHGIHEPFGIVGPEHTEEPGPAICPSLADRYTTATIIGKVIEADHRILYPSWAPACA